MATTYKSIEMAHCLADMLAKRTTLAIVESFDYYGQPLVKVGAGATTNESLLVRIKPISFSLFTDVLGLAQNTYTPHVAQVVVETNAAGNTGVGYVTPANLWPVLAEVYKLGTRIEFYAVANGTGITAVVTDLTTNTDAVQTSIVAANLKSSVEFDQYQKMLASQ